MLNTNLSLAFPLSVRSGFDNEFMLMTFKPPLPLMIWAPVMFPKVCVGARADAVLDRATASLKAVTPTLDGTVTTVGACWICDRLSPDTVGLTSTVPVTRPLLPPDELDAVPFPRRTLPVIGPLLTIIEAF